MDRRKAVFVDRDGVLTREKLDYVKTTAELELLPGVEGPLRRIQKEGFQIVVITNQSAVGRGFTTDEEMGRIHEKLRSELGKAGVYVDGIYYCPHTPEDKCTCRKPEPGLILRAANDLGIDVAASWMIGDKEIDLEAAERAGCRGVRVETNLGDLQQAVSSIICAEKKYGNGETA